MTPERLREIFSYDQETGVFIRKSRGTRAFKAISSTGYLVGSAGGKMYQAHRVAFAIGHGRWPLYQIDHINGNKLDNRLTNLREVTAAENRRNMRRSARNTSGRSGVSFYSRDQRWRVTIGCLHVGLFDTLDEACAARTGAERALGYHENHGREVEAAL